MQQIEHLEQVAAAMAVEVTEAAVIVVEAMVVGGKTMEEVLGDMVVAGKTMEEGITMEEGRTMEEGKIMEVVKIMEATLAVVMLLVEALEVVVTMLLVELVEVIPSVFPTLASQAAAQRVVLQINLATVAWVMVLEESSILRKITLGMMMTLLKGLDLS